MAQAVAALDDGNVVSLVPESGRTGTALEGWVLAPGLPVLAFHDQQHRTARTDAQVAARPREDVPKISGLVLVDRAGWIGARPGTKGPSPGSLSGGT